MQSEVVWSPLAVADLDDIWELIAIENDNPTAADRTVKGILNRVEGIAEYPFASTPLDARCRIHSDWHFIEERGYLVFVRVGKACIYVDRVLSGKSDYLRKLFNLEDGTTYYA